MKRLIVFTILLLETFHHRNCSVVSRAVLKMRNDFKIVLNQKLQSDASTFNYVKHPTLALPVWPVYGGVVAQISDWVLKKPSITDNILNNIGGRVVPMTLGNYDLSPFLLLAHHCHSFTPYDPIRKLSSLVLSEGFPAHPHSGFSTVTFCLEGGMRHRDSEGNRMTYGNGDVQWMRAGRGTIHEEMWDLDVKSEKFQKVELFQLWVNLPEKVKTLYPKVTRLTNESIPVYSDDGYTIKVIAGSLEIDDNNMINGPGNQETSSPVAIMHIKVQPNRMLSLDIPAHASTVVYVRRGSVLLSKNEVILKSTSPDAENMDVEECSSCSLIQFSSKSVGKTTELLNLLAGTNGLDALLLVGEPLNEQVVWQGPLVQASSESWQESANAFNSIGKLLL